MKVRQQLQDKGLVPDDWGGDTIFVDVSALTKQGVDKLLEMILLQADLLELKANPNRRAKGNVIESGLEPGGPTATVLVRKGTLRVGDIVICGQYYGKVRALINEEGKRLKEAGPSVAVKVLGLNGVPEAGLEFSVWRTRRPRANWPSNARMEARALGQEAARQGHAGESVRHARLPRRPRCSRSSSRPTRKARSRPSWTRSRRSSRTRSRWKSSTAPSAPSPNTTSRWPSASNAVILGFHTRMDSGVAEKAKREGVQIKLYAIIYELIDQVKEAMAGLLEPVIKEVVVGAAEVRKIFELSKGVPVAGCVVTSGRIVRGKVRVRAPQGPHLRRRHPVAAPLPGRSQRSPRRHGMRHPHRRLQRVPGRRRDRVLHRSRRSRQKL